MTQLEFNIKYPNAKFLKNQNVEIDNITKFVSYYDNGYVCQTWLEPTNKERFVNYMTKENWKFIFDTMLERNRNNGYIAFIDDKIMFFDSKPSFSSSFVTFFHAQFNYENYDL